MSFCTKKTVTCPKCNNSYEVQIWDSVNVSVDPEEREKILEGTFFKFQCETCGHKVEMVYRCLYHDMERKQMFYLIPDYKPEDVEEMNEVMQKLPVKDTALENGYTMRIVGSSNRLKEKIRIFDAGRDDRVIELCKLYVLHDLAEYHPEIVPLETYYHYQDNEQLILFTENGGALSADLPKELYDLIEQHMQPYLTPLKCQYYTIDEKWAKEFGNIQ